VDVVANALDIFDVRTNEVIVVPVLSYVHVRPHASPDVPRDHTPETLHDLVE